MSNNAYLCCARKRHTYPQFREEDYDSEEQTVAFCRYSVSLLWFCLFRPEDILVEDLEYEGEIYRDPAPVVHREQVAQRLAEAVPRIEGLFVSADALPEYVAMFQQAIDAVDEEYPFLTIELQEVACMVDPQPYYRQVEKILQYMAGAEVGDVKKLLAELCAIQFDRPLPSPNDFAMKDMPEEEWENLTWLLGGEEFRDLPWISLLPSPDLPELVAAIRNRDLKAVCRLLAEGHDPNQAAGSNHGSPLHEAVRTYGADENFDAAVEPLLKAGAKVTDHIMVDAAYSASCTTLAQLIEAGGNPNARAYLKKVTALGYAVEGNRDQVEKVKLLLAAGADPNATYGFGTTALQESVICGALDVADRLVEVTGPEGRNRAMMVAEKRKESQFIELFEKHGISRTLEEGWQHQSFTEMGAPQCPYCGKQLRTSKTKQCFHCGKNWRNTIGVKHMFFSLLSKLRTKR